MNFCPACHNQYEADKKYCRRCGIPLVAEDSLSPAIRAKILIFENRLSKEPENLNHLLEYGKFLSSVSLNAEAQVQLLRGLEIDPAHEGLRRELIRVYQARQDFDLVATHLLVLLETHPDDLSLLENLAEIYLAGGRLAEAAEVQARISERQPGNIQILTDRLKLLQQLGRQQEIIEVCQKLASIAPKDIAPWEFMAQQWLSLGQSREAIAAFEAILKLEPDHPVANYHVGVDRYNLAIQKGEAIHFQEAGRLLKKALNGAARLIHDEADLAKLYYCNSSIHCKEVSPDLLEMLTSIVPHNLQPDGQRLLEECLLSLGDYFEQAGNPQHAMACYEALLKYKDNPQAQERLTTIHVRAGDLFLASGKIAQARREYEKACRYQPNDPEIQEKRRAVVSQERRKTYIIGAIGLGVALVLLVAGLLFYLGQGSLSIRTNTWASISVSRGGEVVASTSGDYLQTPQLRYGSYELLIQKPGYRPVKQVLQVGFSRKPQEVKIDLGPIFGKLKISSEPPGAKVTVRNQYQTKNGTTPCELDGIYAMPVDIKMEIPEYLPYQITKEIPIDQVLDLGTIIFKGSLVVESNPSEAEVWVDGVRKGTTPFRDDKLPAKVTKLEVRKTGAGAYLAEVPIEPGKTINLGIISLDSSSGHVHKAPPIQKKPAESGPEGFKRIPPEPVKTRFTKANDGVITDSVTGLEWYVGPDRDTIWDQAKSWTESLTAAGGGWRMPTIPELKTIYRPGASRNNMDPVFQTTGLSVWSGQLRENSSSFGALFFGYGGDVGLPCIDCGNAPRAFAVRSRSAVTPVLPEPQSAKTRFTRAKEGVIIDSITGLEWYEGPDRDTNWNQAKAWTESLGAAGGGWRMPTVPELNAIYQPGAGNNNRDPIFQMTGYWVWTGQMKDASMAWGFSFKAGRGLWDRLDDAGNGRALAVRSRVDSFSMLPEPVKTRFTKTNDGVISDSATGLDWYLGPDQNTNWNQAKAWTENLTSGRGGWRMPTVPELKALYQKGAGASNMHPIFQTTGTWVWSGQLRDASSAWCFSFRYGKEHWWDLDFAYNGRALGVRSRK